MIERGCPSSSVFEQSLQCSQLVRASVHYSPLSLLSPVFNVVVVVIVDAHVLQPGHTSRPNSGREGVGGLGARCLDSFSFFLEISPSLSHPPQPEDHPYPK